MTNFQKENLLNFSEYFSNDLKCKAYLAEIKWVDGFTCRRCGNNRFSLREDFTRTCTSCKHNESPTSGTVFHKVKFGLQKAFMITYELTNNKKRISSSQIAKQYTISTKAAKLFIHKIENILQKTKKDKQIIFYITKNIVLNSGKNNY